MRTAVLGNDTMGARDASSDERFADTPLKVGAPGIRFYASVPLIDEAVGRGFGAAAGHRALSASRHDAAT